MRAAERLGAWLWWLPDGWAVVACGAENNDAAPTVLGQGGAGTTGGASPTGGTAGTSTGGAGHGGFGAMDGAGGFGG